jgi:PKD repeat protein
MKIVKTEGSKEMIVVLLRFCLLILMASSFIALMGCDEDNGTSGNGPTITSITPTLVYPGQTNVRGTITGTGFVGIGAVDLGPDIQILKTTLVSSTEITVRFTVGANAAPGPRMIIVRTLTGQGQLDGVLSIAENRAPQATFSADPPGGGRGVEITFDASASQDPDGAIQHFEWDFGDGGKGEGKITTHRYEAAGNFTVILTVTDDRQSKSTSNREIKIENTFPPVAHFNFQPQQGDTTTVFSFDGSSSTDSDGRIKSYRWEFGDGAIAER